MSSNATIENPRRARRLVGALAFAVAFGLVGLVLAMHALLVRAEAPEPLAVPSETVVLLMFDGVRLPELIDGADARLAPDTAGAPVLPFLMDDVVPKGRFIGDRSQGSKLSIGNPMGISMPGFQSIFAGRLTFCVTNTCGPLTGRSLLTGLAGQTAFFAAQEALCDSVAALRDAAPALCGPKALRKEAEALALAATSADATVVELGLSQLEDTPPKLLVLGLKDSDTAGHSGDYRAYLDVLAQYDLFTQQIWAEVARLNAAGHPTTLIVTVDHGRGLGDDWTEHSFGVSGTSDIWLLAAGHGIPAAGRLRGGPNRSHFDIRPTIEYLLGAPDPGTLWGSVMTELVTIE